ncbi:hypothetical protein CYY_004112 [Polysphondylium violaceum]|uniref:Uncharacterized protein n=1 Tax=Polysphondylium violaceum TaxID=133409 RepID=A0A8J4PVT2_9MYCE|nr:hypothetical protein CYY_004112 [Polysphondylium violaceum]
MSIYQDILTAQVKQGNFGGKKGQFGYLVDEEKRRKKANKAYEKTKDRRNYKIEITNGVVDVATDSNGLSDPWVSLSRSGGTLKF